MGEVLAGGGLFCRCRRRGRLRQAVAHRCRAAVVTIHHHAPSMLVAPSPLPPPVAPLLPLLLPASLLPHRHSPSWSREIAASLLRHHAAPFERGLRQHAPLQE